MNETLQPFHSISVLNSSFPSSVPPRPGLQSTSVYLLPSFLYVPYLPRISFDSVRVLAEAYLLPEKLHSAHDGLSPVHRDRLTRKASYSSLLPGVCHLDDVLILICGHGGRDARCGLMGPLLRGEFEEKLTRARIDLRRGAADEAGAGEDAGLMTARVGLVSHVGGHKFAGNVIIYLPPQLRLADGKRHPLAGHGIWYGRVEPRHAEGLVEETILKGNVVADLFRGGIDARRQILRL